MSSSPENKRPVTLADVARAAGVSRSTVSKALHAYRSIPESTRQRVLAAAEEVGYRPNPMVQALMAQLHTRRRRQDMTPVIGVIHSWQQSWSSLPTYQEFAVGARQRAEALGFDLQEFSLVEMGLEPVRLARVLQNRGVQGLLFAQAPAGHQELGIPIETFSCATLGPSLREPRIHRASPDHFKAMCLALEQCHALGYRRPGFAVADVADRRLHGIWRSAFLGRGQDLYPETPLPPVHRNAGESLSAFRQWFEQHRPDVIITHALNLPDWLERMRVSVPDDVGLVALGVSSAQNAIAGVDICAASAGREAINLIVNQMHLNERGLPPNRVTVLVEPVWHPARSVKAAK